MTAMSPAASDVSIDRNRADSSVSLPWYGPIAKSLTHAVANETMATSQRGEFARLDVTVGGVDKFIVLLLPVGGALDSATQDNYSNEEKLFERDVLKLSHLDRARVTPVFDPQNLDLKSLESGIVYLVMLANVPSRLALEHFTECLAIIHELKFTVYVLEREKCTSSLYRELGGVEHGSGHIFGCKMAKL